MRGLLGEDVGRVSGETDGVRGLVEDFLARGGAETLILVVCRRPINL